MAKDISLKKAIRSGQLERFIQQEEKRGVPAADSSEFDGALRKIIRPRSKGQTSRSASRDGSTEK